MELKVMDLKQAIRDAKGDTEDTHIKSTFLKVSNLLDYVSSNLTYLKQYCKENGIK
jgi:hypothetical protein